MNPEPRLIEITRGEAWTETWAFKDDDDEDIDLTGCTGELLIFATAAGGVLATGTFTPGETLGEAELALTEEQVATLEGHRVGHWRLIVTDPLGQEHDARGPIYMLD